VYPELVVRDATTSRIDGVRYDELAPMLLNEVQKITERVEGNEALEKQIAVQAAEIRDLKQQVTELKDLKQQMAVMSAALQKLQPKEVLLVQR
jgi:Tfp pilus assembly protein PilN